MYLINVNTKTIDYFPEVGQVKYGILSHRWEHEEITLQDIRSDTASSKYGFIKLQKACEQAKIEGLDYIWIDTCCIDKTSSAELSEAINSMFEWYSNASICLVYLLDVDDVQDIRNSAWFTRGWTLQELIAPRFSKFFGRNWNELGTKASLESDLSSASGVPAGVLNGETDFMRLNVAQRMSWAARRETTRREDKAYCLMGLFDINMPLLYGEGDKAFVRLQEEIIKQLDDHTIFAWHLTDSNIPATGFLAPSPKAFENCSLVVRRKPVLDAPSFVMTNRGLSIQLPVIQWSYNFRIGLLNCVYQYEQPEMKSYTIGLLLRPLEEATQYVRVALCGQDRILFDEDCFNRRKNDNVPFAWTWNAGLLNAIFYNKTVEGPLLYNARDPVFHWDKNRIRKFHSTTLHFRQKPLNFSTLEPVKPRSVWLRKFVPFAKSTNFDRKKDFKIRCWGDWSFDERRVFLPEGFIGGLFVIEVRGKQITQSIDSSKAGVDANDKFRLNVPSRLLALSVSRPELDWENNGRTGSIDWAADPTDAQLACMDDAKSDATVLNAWDADKYGKGWKGCWIQQRSVSHDLHGTYCSVYGSIQMIDGIDTFVLDVLWSGPRSQCDECNKILTLSQYCCLSCEQYDCCEECFDNLPQTGHDAESERQQHRFRRVILEGDKGRQHFDSEKKKSSRLEV